MGTPRIARTRSTRRCPSRTRRSPRARSCSCRPFATVGLKAYFNSQSLLPDRHEAHLRQAAWTKCSSGSASAWISSRRRHQASRHLIGGMIMKRFIASLLCALLVAPGCATSQRPRAQVAPQAVAPATPADRSRGARRIRAPAAARRARPRDRRRQSHHPRHAAQANRRRARHPTPHPRRRTARRNSVQQPAGP